MEKLMKMVLGGLCLMFGASSALAAEPVSYLDWDGEKLVPAVCTEYEVVTNEANAFAAGKTYVVQGEVSTTNRITVEGTEANPTRLILCDGATLTANAGITVTVNGETTNALVICGQQGGTGALEATDVADASGIGGGDGGAGGTVTINGGCVTAQGDTFAAGIGGGDYGAGGTVTINGGTVTATGGDFAAGIGGGCDGVGGTVTINGGTVTATGSDGGSGIGGGDAGAGGTVVIRNGAVKVFAEGEASVIGHGSDNDDEGSVSISGGIFAMTVEDDWCVTGYGAFDNPDPETKDDYPYAVVPAVNVTVLLPEGVHAFWTGVDGSKTNAVEGGCFLVQPGTSDVKLLYEVDSTFIYVGGERTHDLGVVLEDQTVECHMEVVHREVEYVDGDGQIRTNSTFRVVDENTTTLTDGWYLVEDNVVIDTGAHIVVSGSAHLILGDGASLTVENVDGNDAAIGVSAGELVTNALSIYGQSKGSGRLTATGGSWAAGIGGGDGGAGGTVTINGGFVTTTGGNFGGSGIGGGRSGAGGTVTINGGFVTATGDRGAGIGGGAYGAGGMVTINGGAVTATGVAAGIGGDRYGAGGTVVFGENFEGGVLAGDDAAHAAFMTTDAYVKKHDAKYVTMPVAVLMIPMCEDCTCVVSNDVGEIAAVPVNDANIYMVTTGDTVKVYFTPATGYRFVGDFVNPMDLGEITELVTVVDETKFPTVELLPVDYLDWDGEKLVPATCTDYEIVTNGANVFAAGKIYVVREEVSTANRITVNGTVANPARLVLCDGATLKASRGLEVTVGEDGATTNALVICGQQDGTGALDAQGVAYDAGIGGADGGAGGAVTINGGTVTAQGCRFAAGIGGGYDGGAGGTVTINGGTVTAQGGWYGAGIGGGYGGAGGTVTIKGGTVTAQGGSYGAGIGGGRSGAGGTVVFGENFEGGVLAGDDAAHAAFMTADAYVKNHDAKYVTMPVAVLMIPMRDGCTCVVSNGVGEIDAVPSDDTNVYVVTTGDTVKVYFAPEPGYRFVGDFVNPMELGEITEWVTVVDETKLPTVGLDYLDWDGAELVPATCTEYEVVTNEANVFAAGKTYVVKGEVSTTILITVEGTTESPTRLILCDGATLTASYGIKVTVNGATTNALVICGQRGGTGIINATGGHLCAGIGGGYQGDGGTVTINGGMVMVQGGHGAAGIGGGSSGGYSKYGAGGTVTINGGVVTVAGGNNGAGFGGGYGAAGGMVKINGGAVKVVAGSDASVIGHGSDNDDEGSVSISGGIFAMTVENSWLAENSRVIDNPDPETKTDYPYQVIALFKLTVPQVEHATVEVATNGTVVTGFAGSVDVVQDSMVRVAFTAEADYRIVANGEKEWRAVCDVTFGMTPDFPLPTIEGIPGTQVNPWQVGEDVVAYTNANGVLTITGTGATDDFASAADVPWNPAVVTSVTIGDGVTHVGKNVLAGFLNTVTVNGTPLSFYDMMADARGLSEPVIPEGMVLVSKTELEAAGAETVEIVGGTAYLGVSVRTNADITAETKSWGKVDVRPGDVSVKNGSVIIAVPANAERGFMVLESGD